MSSLLESRERSDGNGSSTSDPNEESIADSSLFRLGRVMFGGILAFNAVDNLRNLDERIAYAEAKGVPYPGLSVPAASGGLLLGGIGVVLWRVPSAAAGAVAWFLAAVTPVMHDFWNHDDPERQQDELVHFLKNTALLGAALAFLRIGRRDE